ncbi:4-coumarate-CoA ligase [Stagonosporopsis vannaccii]|nr:4-coumarate-CoA ligase [Stagonosporopsis vannaccii]
MVYSSEYVLDYPDEASISDLLFDYNIGGALPSTRSIIDGPTGEVIYTYSSLRSAVRRFAAYLQRNLQIGRGDVICILAFNTVRQVTPSPMVYLFLSFLQTSQVHYPVYVHAVLALGGVVSGLNPYHMPESIQELSHALSIARPKHVLVGSALTSNLQAAMELLQMARPHTSILATEPRQQQTNSIDVLHILKHGDVVFNRPTYGKGEIAKELAFICFSSGTSGLPKGVRLSHGNIVSNVYMHSIYLSEMFTPTNVFALVVPFFHILGLQGFSCLYVINGVPIVVFPKFDLQSLLKSISRDKGEAYYPAIQFGSKKTTVTHLNVVPPIALQLLNTPLATDIDTSSLKCLMNAAAPLEQSLSDRLCAKLDCSMTQWYGLTEGSPSVISQRQDQVHIKGTVGKLLPGLVMRVVDHKGEECPHGVPGELCVRGPSVMQGYVGDEELTTATITSDGYLHTGDIGYVDDNGYVFLVDRIKEMIKVKGNQVAPAELEGILRLHPLVVDAAVCGKYIAAQGTEVPVAYVVTKAPVSEHEHLRLDVLASVGKSVSSYKKIRDLAIVNDIPRK